MVIADCFQKLFIVKKIEKYYRLKKKPVNPGDREKAFGVKKQEDGPNKLIYIINNR